MKRVIAFNGSPGKEKGAAAKLLGAFLRGMLKGRSKSEINYINGMEIKPSVGELFC